jgi:hypothetical protein
LPLSAPPPGGDLIHIRNILSHPGSSLAGLAAALLLIGQILQSHPAPGDNANGTQWLLWVTAIVAAIGGAVGK